VRARVTVAECATRCSINGAGPSARYVVIRPANDPIGIIRINGDRRFVLRRCRGVSVHKDVRRDNRGAIKRAGWNVNRRNGGRRGGTFFSSRSPLDECGEAKRQTSSPSEGGSLASKSFNIVRGRSHDTSGVR